MQTRKRTAIVFVSLLFTTLACFKDFNPLIAQTAMANVYGRKSISLDGTWKVIIDPSASGDWRKVWTERKPQAKTEFVEYSFEGGETLRVPGDFNTQKPELTFYEGVVWYKKAFNYKHDTSKRLFLYFGAINYLSSVYLNGKLLGTHEGGFTPFQFELTGQVLSGVNSIVVKVDNHRKKDGLPGPGYDWFNYGGITRSVYLIQTNNTFIEDYSIQLSKNSLTEVSGWIKLNGQRSSGPIHIRIPELKLDYQTQPNGEGFAEIKFSSAFQLWSPRHPKLYNVIIQSASDTVNDIIGFRSLSVSGTKTLLNGEPIFFKGVNIHEESPFKAARAYSEADAITLLGWARDLGCNLVRLAHYPHNEYMIRQAEKMGLMVWDELPIYQHIEFVDTSVQYKMSLMLNEMIRRDRNRCAVVIWSLSNETLSSTPNRTDALIELSKQCRLQDSTRFITSVINNQGYENNTVNVWDTLYRYFDIMSINEYFGWYVPWQGKSADTKWKLIEQKPIIISEFGGEAKFKSTGMPKDAANSWSEEYQEQIYKDQVAMFREMPNLAGVCPWLLVDYRSPGRMHPVYQKGYNRKGLLSESGQKKKAWYVMKKFFE